MSDLKDSIVYLQVEESWRELLRERIFSLQQYRNHCENIRDRYNLSENEMRYLDSTIGDSTDVIRQLIIDLEDLPKLNRPLLFRGSV